MRLQVLQSAIDADTTMYVFAFGPQEVEGVLRLDPDGYILSCFVIPAARGRGVGTAMLLRAFDELRRLGRKTVGLSVHHDNQNARRLYERLGFLPYIAGHEGYTQFVKAL